MRSSKTPVLIIGAGPTGLMAACQLARYGIPFRILDKKSGTTPFSKAIVVHARSVEIYDQMGLADEAIRRGSKTTAMNLLVEGKKVQRIPLSDIGADLSPFPFLLSLEQSKNEDLLYETLRHTGREVEWDTEMLRLEPTDDGACVDIRHKDGSEERIEASYVIAADGGKSPVRHALGLKFEGDTYENIFYVVDTHVQWDLGYNELFVNLVDSSFCGFFPMGEDRFRLVGILPKEFEKEDDITFEDIQESIKKQQKIPLTFGKTNWFSVYRVHHRVIETFRKGRVFFAGDAAHVHSPAGGQGMNTGLQDATNLIWKLAWVVRGQATSALLDTYDEERLPNAKELVATTDRAFTNVIAKGTILNFFKLNVLPFLAGTVMGWESIRRTAFKTVSQIRIHYRDRSLSENAGVTLHKEMPHAGDRLPYVQIYDEDTREHTSIFRWLRTTRFVALLWLHNADSIGDTDAGAFKAALQHQYPSLFDFHVIHNITENMVSFARMHVEHSMVYLVRPDGYIGYIGEVENTQAALDYLKKFLIPAHS